MLISNLFYNDFILTKCTKINKEKKVKVFLQEK